MAGVYLLVLNLSDYVYTEVDGLAGLYSNKPVSVVPHFIYYSHFLPIQHPSHFLLPPCLLGASQTVEPVWPATPGQPGMRLPGTQGPSSCLCPALPTAAMELTQGQPTVWKNMHNFLCRAIV